MLYQRIQNYKILELSFFCDYDMYVDYIIR